MLELPGHAVAERQIAGPDKQQVKSGNGGDGVDRLHGLPILDLQREEDFFVSVPDVFERIGGAPIRIRARSIEPTPAQRRESHPIHPLLRFLRAAAMRDHDAIGAALE